jgi:hypothetical protein
LLKTLLAALLVLVCANQGVTAADEESVRTGGAEVQINLCSEPRQVITALKLKRQDAKSGEVWYFDTAKRVLFKRGVLFRLRITSRKSELTLKVANQDCAKVNPELLPAGRSKCEYDLHGAHLAGSVSVSSIMDDRQVRGLIEGRLALADLLSPAQIRYLQEGAAVWPLPSGLKRLGPARIETYRRKSQLFDVELWELPSGRRYLEISQKSRLEDARRVQTELEEVLARKQLQLCPDQESQTGGRLEELLLRN